MNLLYFSASVVGDYMMIHGGQGTSGKELGDARFYSFVISAWSIPVGQTPGLRYGHTAGNCRKLKYPTLLLLISLY